jgi:phytoene dehydrogenase-like protein
MALASLLSLLLAALHAASYPILVRGADEASFKAAPSGPALKDRSTYDAIVVGGGLAGLTAGVYLSDAGKKVLLLEKEDVLGGLAAGGNRQGVNFDRGAAYWTSAYDEELKILERMGLGKYKEEDQIHEPSDSFFWKGKLHVGMWEEKWLEEMPANFALFRAELLAANKAGLIPNQPIEEAADLVLDTLNANEWVRRMPLMAATRSDDESKKVYKRFLEDKEVDRADPMADVLGLLDIFSRSALGTTTENLSAAAFANFYISEIEPRFTTPIGTGEAARLLEGILRKRKSLVTIKLKAPATRVESGPDGVEVSYVEDGKLREAKAAYAVYAGQLKFAPKLIAGFAEKEPERAELLSKMDYAHFSVHIVFAKGHPYRATYDTWTRPSDYSPEDFTDVILGRWMDPAIRGYDGLRDFKKNPPDEHGILAVYHPLSLTRVGQGYTRETAEELAGKAVDRMLSLFNPMLKEAWGTKIEVQSVETNRWPYSIHIARPGHFSKTARKLRRPFGRVFFANNNLGTPAFEEALFRGHCAADNVLKKLDPAFSFEAWTRCPLEK